MTTLARDGGLTREDLDAMPDDGRTHELVDGVLVVRGSPSARHQDIIGSLYRLLWAARPRDLKVLLSPFDVVLSGHTVIRPDIVVARRTDVTETDLPTAPLLAVEVLSPSTQWLDLGRKAELLAGAGCPSYWVVDPGAGATPPTLTVFELVDGRYAESTRVGGDQSWTATAPFEVTVVPAQLLDQ